MPVSRFAGLASYVTVNISSPNTKNLRQLQGASELDSLLGALKQRQTELAQHHGRHVPLALKIAPDLDDDQIANIADALRRHRIDAVIATNTTLDRSGVESSPLATETGGLSGAPLFTKSTAVIRRLAASLAGEVPIIAAGGIFIVRRSLLTPGTAPRAPPPIRLPPRFPEASWAPS